MVGVGRSGTALYSLLPGPAGDAYFPCARAYYICTCTIIGRGKRARLQCLVWPASREIEANFMHRGCQSPEPLSFLRHCFTSHYIVACQDLRGRQPPEPPWFLRHCSIYVCQGCRGSLKTSYVLLYQEYIIKRRQSSI